MSQYIFNDGGLNDGSAQFFVEKYTSTSFGQSVSLLIGVGPTHDGMQCWYGVRILF